jgi:hypothetical protein
MAEGLSNRGLRSRPDLSPRTVETHVYGIFGKLRLPPAADDHRRVLAARVPAGELEDEAEAEASASWMTAVYETLRQTAHMEPDAGRSFAS